MFILKEILKFLNFSRQALLISKSFKKVDLLANTSSELVCFIYLLHFLSALA